MLLLVDDLIHLVQVCQGAPGRLGLLNGVAACPAKRQREKPTAGISLWKGIYATSPFCALPSLSKGLLIFTHMQKKVQQVFPFQSELWK